jgi:hypothetical protein
MEFLCYSYANWVTQEHLIELSEECKERFDLQSAPTLIPEAPGGLDFGNGKRMRMPWRAGVGLGDCPAAPYDAGLWTGSDEERTFSLYFESDQWTVYEIASIIDLFQTITTTTAAVDDRYKPRPFNVVV